MVLKTFAIDTFFSFFSFFAISNMIDDPIVEIF
jgi:hypothetical protein